MKLETGWTPAAQAFAISAVATMETDVALAAANDALAGVFLFYLGLLSRRL